MIELLQIGQFIAIKEKGKGYIAITDKNLPKNCVHHTSCCAITEYYFEQKVIRSNRKNGSYYFMDDFNEALSNLKKMTTCQKCF